MLSAVGAQQNADVASTVIWHLAFCIWQHTSFSKIQFPEILSPRRGGSPASRSSTPMVASEGWIVEDLRSTPPGGGSSRTSDPCLRKNPFSRVPTRWRPTEPSHTPPPPPEGPLPGGGCGVWENLHLLVAPNAARQKNPTPAPGEGLGCGRIRLSKG